MEGRGVEERHRYWSRDKGREKEERIERGYKRDNG